MLISELFKEFYAPTHHSESAYYLFFGLDGKTALLPWIWTSISMNVVATVVLTFHKLRNNFKILFFVCILLFVAIWIEKGFGLIVPGFITCALICSDFALGWFCDQYGDRAGDYLRA